MPAYSLTAVSKPTIALLTVAALAAALATTQSSAHAAGQATPGTLLVGFKKDVSAERQNELLAAADGRIDERLKAIRDGRLAVVRPRSGVGLAVLRKRLADRPEIAYAERDFIQRASKSPDDPQYPTQYALVEDSADHDIDAPAAWDTRTGCSKVAVLDSGVEFDHPDLEGNVYKSDDKSGDGKDNDKNGWVDDTYGLNVIKGEGSGKDQNGHGTHVAGIIAGRGNNSEGVSGICWSGKVLPVRFLDEHGRGKTSDAIKGIEYAVKQGMKIINCSFGSSSKSESLKDAIEYAESKNVLLVVAAGNDGENIDKSPIYPASYGDKNILTVAATTATDQLADFSNFGDEDVDVAAPGNDIRSTYLDGSYRFLSGTSMASPYAAGLAAMLRKQEDKAKYGDLRKAIKEGVDKPDPLKGKVVTDGRINARRALSKIKAMF